MQCRVMACHPAAPAAPVASQPAAPAPQAGSFAGTVDIECDMLVLGSGPGGYSAAFRAAAADHNRFDRRLWEHARTTFAARCEHLTTGLLSLPLAESGARGAVRYLRRDVTEGVPRPNTGVRGRVSGWILVGERAPDAVLVRAGDVERAAQALHSAFGLDAS